MIDAAYHMASPSKLRFAPRLRAAARPGELPLRTGVEIDPDFSITRDGYHVRLAHGMEHLRSRISLLVERMYAWRGLHTDHPVMQADRPGQTTLVACSGDHLFGTLTVGIDTEDGLLADTLYRQQIDAARRRGGRVCEVTRLAMDPTLSTPEVMATIFHLGFVIAHAVHGMTDSFIEVHPRHTGFYKRMLGYDVAGPERTCPRVGAPAVLMHLSLEHAEREIRRHGGNRHTDDRSLYRLFLSQAEHAEMLTRLRGATAGK